MQVDKDVYRDVQTQEIASYIQWT